MTQAKANLMSAEQVAHCLDACAKEAHARADDSRTRDLDAYSLTQLASAQAYALAAHVVRLNLVLPTAAPVDHMAQWAIDNGVDHIKSRADLPKGDA